MNTLLIGCALSVALGFGLGYWRGLVRGRAEGLLLAACELLGSCASVAKETTTSAERLSERLRKGVDYEHL